jgi:hypothetical protein
MNSQIFRWLTKLPCLRDASLGKPQKGVFASLHHYRTRYLAIDMAGDGGSGMPFLSLALSLCSSVHCNLLFHTNTGCSHSMFRPSTPPFISSTKVDKMARNWSPRIYCTLLQRAFISMTDWGLTALCGLVSNLCCIFVKVLRLPT